MTDTADSQSTLAARIRRILDERPLAIREARMFGGLAFMVNGGLAISAAQDGSVLVRVNPLRRDELLAMGGEAAQMGPNRTMSRGWLRVAASRVVDDADLARWIDIGVEATPDQA
jgi:hypothetical protein